MSQPAHHTVDAVQMKQAPGQNGHEYFIAQQMEVVNMMPGEYPQPTSFPDAMMLESMPQEPWVGAPFDFPMEGYSFDGNQIRRTSTGEASVEATSSGDSGRSSLPPADLKKAKEQERQERRRAQNRAAQRQFRQRRQLCIKENSARLETLEAEVTALTSDNSGLSSTITRLKSQILNLQRENRGLRRQSDAALASESEDESQVRGMSDFEVEEDEEPLRWHWMKVKKEREMDLQVDDADVPSKFD